MRALWLAVLLFNTVQVAAQTLPFDRIAYEDAATGFRFPEMIVAYKFVHTQDFGPRQGKGVHYVEVTGTKASVFFYNKELKDLQEGIVDPRLNEEIASIEAGLAEMVRRGKYQSTRRVDLGPPLSKGWVQVNHEIQLPGGVPALRSYSFLRIQNGNFVKVRVSGVSEGSYARLPSFLLGVSRAIGMLSGPAQ